MRTYNQIDMNIQQLILDSGTKAGMCQKFQGELLSGEKSIDQLCSMYHRGLDFCIEHNFPSRDIVRQFRREDLARNGIYYDVDNYDIINQKHIVVNGKSDVDIYVRGISDIYLRDNTKARLHVEDNAFVYVTLYNASQVSVVLRGKNARICASVYSGRIVNDDQFDRISYKQKIGE